MAQPDAINEIAAIGLAEGDRFITYAFYSSLTSGQTRSMVFRNPAGSGKVVALDAPLVEATNRVNTVLRRNVTIDTAGTILTPRNGRVGAPDNASSEVQRQPTVSGGTILNEAFAGGGGGGSTAIAGDQSGASLLVEPGNNVYIQATTTANGTGMHLEIDFTEFDEDLISP